MCRRKMKAEVKKWAKQYDKTGTFPEPALVPVPPGTTIHCGDLAGDLFSPLAPQSEGWYFYFVKMFGVDVSMAVSVAHKDQPMFNAVYEAFVCRYPWGGLSLATNNQLYNSNALIAQRLESVVAFWEQLDTIRYINPFYRKCSLWQIVSVPLEGTIRLWVEAPTSDLREMLRITAERMRNASEDETYARIMRRLHHVADTDPRLKRREWLKSPGFLEAKLAHMKETLPDGYEYMKTGQHFAEYLAERERRYPDG